MDFNEGMRLEIEQNISFNCCFQDLVNQKTSIFYNDKEVQDGGNDDIYSCIQINIQIKFSHECFNTKH